MGTASDYGTPTPNERFRDKTGLHPAIWVALILTLLLVALS